MKPKNIFLIRHGQSEGNVDKSIYKVKPDYAYRLTDLGREQANAVGKELSEKLWGSQIEFYYSPFFRTRDTFLEIAKHVRVRKAKEDPRLREQEWGTSFRDQEENLEHQRDTYGHYYYRIKDGESCADVYDRVSDFMNTLHRDFEKEEFPQHVGIVMHGMTMRVFLMRWFHWTVEKFESLANPKNCEYYHLEYDDEAEKYYLKTEPRVYPHYNHPHQYPELKHLELYAS